MVHRNFTPFPILTTQRLTLRQPGMHDVQEIFSLRSDSNVHQYLDRPMANTIDDARDFIHKIINSHSLYWAITFSDNVLVGTICVFNFSDENDACEIGYELLPKFQGKGIMMEAMEAVIDYVFNTLHVRKIEAFVHRENLASIRVLEKFLFKEVNEPEADMVCYCLIKPS